MNALRIDSRLWFITIILRHRNNTRAVFRIQVAGNEFGRSEV